MNKRTNRKNKTNKTNKTKKKNMTIKSFVFIVLFLLSTIIHFPINATGQQIQTPRASIDEWSEPCGDSLNSGYSDTSLPDEITVSWSKTMIDFFESQPLVSDGTLVVIQNKIYAFDAQTGTEKWTYDTNSKRTPPAIGGGRIF